MKNVKSFDQFLNESLNNSYNVWQRLAVKYKDAIADYDFSVFENFEGGYVTCMGADTCPIFERIYTGNNGQTFKCEEIVAELRRLHSEGLEPWPEMSKPNKPRYKPSARLAKMFMAIIDTYIRQNKSQYMGLNPSEMEKIIELMLVNNLFYDWHKARMSEPEGNICTFLWRTAQRGSSTYFTKGHYEKSMSKKGDFVNIDDENFKLGDEDYGLEDPEEIEKIGSSNLSQSEIRKEILNILMNKEISRPSFEKVRDHIVDKYGDDVRNMITKEDYDLIYDNISRLKEYR
jgi:hypothetical protein